VSTYIGVTRAGRVQTCWQYMVLGLSGRYYWSLSVGLHITSH